MIHDKSSIHPALEAVRQSLTEAISICTGAGVMGSSGIMSELKDMHTRTIELQRDLASTLERPDVMPQTPKLAPGRELPSLEGQGLEQFCQSISYKDLLTELHAVGRLGPAMVQKIAELQRGRKIKPGLNKYLMDLAEVEGTPELN